MRKFVFLTVAILFLSFFGNFGKNPISADDVNGINRDDRPVLSREDRPVIDREDRIINPKFKSKLYPTTPPTGGVSDPTVTPDPGNGDSDDDPCAPGKSYIGPYCGWSPEHDKDDDGGNGGGGEGRVGGPQVLGLSTTSSSDLGLSDIIFLSGVLCLLVYARSKVATRKSL